MVDEVERAVNNFQQHINNLIERSLKRYCQVYSYDYNCLVNSKSLTREVLPNKTIYKDGNVTIFVIKKSEVTPSDNKGIIGYSVSYELEECF